MAPRLMVATRPFVGKALQHRDGLATLARQERFDYPAAARAVQTTAPPHVQSRQGVPADVAGRATLTTLNVPSRCASEGQPERAVRLAWRELVRTRVLVADDHTMVADGLGRIVAEVAELLGPVHDGQQLVESARRLKPDIVISDIEMPELSGIDAMRRLLAEGTTARFILLTMHRSPELAAEALRTGASGYLLKEDAGDELLGAIRAVIGGRTYLTPRLTASVLRQMSAAPDAVSTLTDRQREVLRLIALGKRMKEIAAALDISVRTVEGHKAQLMDRLDCESTADLVRVAIRQRIVPE